MKRLLLTGLLLVFSRAASTQDFLGDLRAQGAGYAQVKPGHVLVFPRDHGPHPDYRIEWWYLTANLTSPDGTEYGVQWTLFRSALAPPGSDAAPQVWMGHAAVTTPDRHFAAERFARSGIGQADVSADPFAAFIDDSHGKDALVVRQLGDRAS